MIRIAPRGVCHALAAGLLAAATPGLVQAAEPDPAAQVVGEKPAATTAERVALRDQGVLLQRNRLTVELALAYGRAERDFGITQLQQQVASTELAVRYGVWRDVQLSVRLPWSYRRVASFNPDASDHRSSFGDASVGLFGVAVREGVGRPNVILSADGVVPTGPGDAALGGGVSLTKSYDPVILFAGASYLYGLSTNVASLDRSLAEHNVGFNLGLAFAVNESVALGAQLAGTNRSYPAARTGFRSREQYRLQLGVTLLVTRRLFIEPIVATAVGSGSPDLTLGVSVPVSF
jgi:hypothetical protein